MTISLALVLTVVFLVGCASESDSAQALESQVVTVQRGNLIIDITAVGNLAFSRTDELAFEISGTVGEVLVEEGDIVEEGQVLAKLDTSEWEDNLSVLEDQVTTKERNLLQKEISLRNTEIALEKAQDTYTWPELEVAIADVEEAEARLQYALDHAAEGGGDNWDRVVKLYQNVLDAAEKRLNAMLTGADTDEVAIKKLELELAQGQLEDAEKALVDAQEELDEAKSESPIIVVPFDGFITEVNVSGGDEVLKGTVAVQLADPNKFEADILVSEMDIFQVKLGGEAWVQVDAMQGMSLPAKVTHIAPTATIQAGVVNYTVKVEIESLEAAMQERQEARQQMTQDISPEELPERLRQAIEEGSITQEQAEEMITQRHQEQGGQQEMPTILPEGFQLREGLTVTVSIIIQERNNVLLVPNQAITTEGRETYVQVLKDGIVEERPIKTGISNWQYTEVTDGLSEGEKVIVPQGTTTMPTTPQQGSRMPFFPGGEGPH